jgi:hypothetical protein
MTEKTTDMTNDIIPVLKENIESVVGCDADEEIEVIDNMIR